MNGRKCSRCGKTKDIEKHHIIQKSEGGSNKKSNLQSLCKDCHDYEHARRLIEHKLNYYIKRVELLKHRLEVLNKLNSVDIIKIGKYISYWEDPSTHGESNRNFKKKKK